MKFRFHWAAGYETPQPLRLHAGVLEIPAGSEPEARLLFWEQIATFVNVLQLKSLTVERVEALADDRPPARAGAGS